MEIIKLFPLTPDDRDQFILDNQEAFRYGALEEFGCRDDHFEEPGEIISRKTIERAIAAILICCLFYLKRTARASATPRGAQLKSCIPR